MREIKFRMWREGRMQGVHTMYSKVSEDWKPQDGVPPQNFAFNQGEVLMQFTGLTDESGKEIYEGDVIQGDFGHPLLIGYCTEAAGFVGSKTNDFSINQIYNFGTDIIMAESWEIIGNIYENPELFTGIK